MCIILTKTRKYKYGYNTLTAWKEKKIVPHTNGVLV